MAQLVALYIEGSKIYTFDGTNSNTNSIPTNLMSVTKPYGAALTWATDLVTSLLGGHDNIVILSGNIDTQLENPAAGDFKGFHEISAANLLKIFVGAVNKYISDNSATKKAFQLTYKGTRHFCYKCQEISTSPNTSSRGAFTSLIHMSKCGHDNEFNKQIVYSLHKSLTTAMP